MYAQKFIKHVFLVIAMLMVLISSTHAEIPRTITYQGSLKETNGTPVNDTLSMTFALYESLAGDTELWIDTLSVPVTQGVYSVLLGGTVENSIDLPFDQTYYLEVSVNDQKLAPRQPLTGVPYALNAAHVEGITIDDGDVGIGTTHPEQRLHLKAKEGAEDAYIVLTNGKYHKALIGYDGGSNGLEFRTQGAARLFIGDTGNVGIGTTTPGMNLDVVGYARILAQGKYLSGLAFQRQDEDNRMHKWHILHMPQSYRKNALELWEYKADGNGESCNGNPADGAMCTSRLTLLEGGKMGIGNRSPQYRLDVAGSVRADNVPLTSDRRWKQEIATLENSLSRISRLRGVSFRWKDPGRGDGPQIGLIAQEVEEIFPEFVSTDGNGYKSVSYAKLVAPLIEALKELKAENEALAAQNADFARRLSALEAIVQRQ